MQLDPNWKEIATRAWSVRLITLSAILSIFETYLPSLEPLALALNFTVPDGLFASASALCAMLAAIARVLAQGDMPQEASK